MNTISICPRALMPRTAIVGCAVVMLANIPAAESQPAFFMGLGRLPGGAHSWATDISADGSTVVGRSEVAGGTDSFRWTRETGMVAVGAPTTVNKVMISADGTSIIGSMGAGHPDQTVPYRWSQATGVQALPMFVSTQRWAPTAVNGDGSLIIGQRVYPLDVRFAVKWTSSGDVVKLFGESDRLAEDVSDDGKVVVAEDPGRTSSKFIWTAEGGFQSLPQPALGSWYGYNSIAADGKVVLGDGFLGGDIFVGNGNHRALRWTKEAGTLTLPSTPDGFIPFCVSSCSASADGSVVVGNATGGTDHPLLGFSTFIWDQLHGSRNLRQLLINEYGLLNALAGWRLESFDGGISADGRTIVGSGISPAGNREAWIAYLGTPTASVLGDYNGNGTVDAADYIVWRNLSGQTGAGLAADGNGDGTVNGADYDLWRAHFGQTATSAIGATTSVSSSVDAAVPEATTFLLAALALSPLAWQARALRQQLPDH